MNEKKKQMVLDVIDDKNEEMVEKTAKRGADFARDLGVAFGTFAHTYKSYHPDIQRDVLALMRETLDLVDILTTGIVGGITETTCVVFDALHGAMVEVIEKDG